MKLLFTSFLIILNFYHIQKPNNAYKIGDKVNNFILYNALDNSKVSLNDFSESKAVAVVFSSHTCPYSKIYEDRLIEIIKEYGNKEVQFIFINPNHPSLSADDNMANMNKWAKQKAYSFPYLSDQNQTVSSVFGATRTPEVFIMKNINGNFILQYKGAIDDNPQVAAKVSQSFLKDALDSILANRIVKISEKKATGCMIKKP